VNPDRRLRGCTIRILDTETTGLSGQDGLIEIAIVQIDELAERDRTAPRLLFTSLIDPGIPGPWQGTYAHGLTEIDVRGAPTWAEVREQVRPLLCDPEVLLCAHHASFDYRFLASGGLSLPEAGSWIDTLRIAQQLDPTPGLAKLGRACADRGIPLDGHRAASDAIATGHLLPRLIRDAYQLPADERPPERPTIQQWLDWQRRRPSRPKAAQAMDGQASLFDQAAPVPADPAPRRRSDPPVVWVVRGGVGGVMYCAAANGLNPFRWTHRPDGARRFSDELSAAEVAARVGGQAVRASG
jgi:DNA polymerase III epsilon subunit-like protein